jgi:hypothetical protein
MKSMRSVFIILACLWGAAAASPVFAHQPRLIYGDRTVEIRNPEVSQAFYAEMQGSLHLYQIDTEREFQLYLGLLVPHLPRVDRDISATVSGVAPDGTAETLFMLDGAAERWEPYFEPFAGDRYYKGPERTETLPAGMYRIEVSSPDNRGKYVLAVGKKEKFTVAETAAMITVLPALKRDFFGKSPLAAFFNLVGLFMFLALLVLAGAAAGVFRLIRFALNRIS